MAYLFSLLLPTNNTPVPTHPNAFHAPITPLQSIAALSDDVFTASRELPASRTTRQFPSSKRVKGK